MNKIFRNFVKDQSLFLIFYFTSSFLIILFYYLITSGQVEIIYPMSISIFVFLIYFIISFFRYYSFNKDLNSCINNMDYDLRVSTCEHKRVKEVVNAIHQNYALSLQQLKLNNLNKNRFISQWIHNMKTPVSVSDLILQKKTLREEDIVSLQEENEKLLTQLEQVLTLIRLDDFSNDYVPASVNLTESLRSIINSKKNQFIYNHVYPKLNISSPHLVLTDEKWNRMIVEQIINNAIKYSATDGNADDSNTCSDSQCIDSVSVGITDNEDESSRSESIQNERIQSESIQSESTATSKNVYFDIYEQEGNTVLSITDEGVGIAEHDQRRIFEPFFTGENGRKLQNSTGIGLYLAREIASKLGHKLEIESQQCRGTTVKITYLSKL